MEPFLVYSHAILSIALWIVVVQLLSAWTGGAKAGAGITPGGVPQPEDYGNKTYRIHRAYENSVANLGVLTSAVVIAMVAGAAPFWVNLLASVAVVARLAMVVVHIQGIGKPTQGLRTFIFVFHWALILALAVMAAVAVL